MGRYLEISVSRRYYPEYFLSSEDVIPDTAAAEIDVEISVTARNRHQAILLDLEISMFLD